MVRPKFNPDLARGANVNLYLSEVNSAVSLSEVNGVVERAADDDTITNSEYEEVYQSAINWFRNISKVVNQ